MEYSDYRYVYINNVFGHFVKDTMDFFVTKLYPRFEWKVIGTYDKAVEYINKQEEFNQEVDMPIRPGIILNPTGDMNLDENYGKMAARFPQFGMGLVKYMFNPIYRDENVLINVSFTRIKGELEFTALFPSFYEYFDFKIYLLNICRGINRYVNFLDFDTFITIPEELYNYKYTNDITGESYTLDWTKHSVSDVLLKSTNTTEKVYPVRSCPKYILSGMSDASSRLGGLQNLPDWKLSFTFEYEIDMPSFIVLQSDYIATDLKVDIRTGSAYSINNSPNDDENEYNTDGVVPIYRHTFQSHVDFDYNTTSFYKIAYPENAQILDREDLKFKNRYYHILTEEDIEKTTDIEIDISEPLTDYKYFIVFTKYGQLEFGDDYRVVEDGNSLLLKREFLKHMSFGDVIEIYVYGRFKG